MYLVGTGLAQTIINNIIFFNYSEIELYTTHRLQLNLEPPHFALVNGNRAQLSPFIVNWSPTDPHPNIHAMRALHLFAKGQVVVPN